MMATNYLRALLTQTSTWCLYKCVVAECVLTFLSFSQSIKLSTLYKSLIITPPPFASKNKACYVWEVINDT